MRLIQTGSFAVAALALLGCPPGGGGGAEGGAGGASLPRQAPPCATDFPEDYPESRALEIGTGTAGDFTPWHPGDTVPLYQGNQGLRMTTPSLRLPAGDADPDQACFRVRLENDYQGAILGDPTARDAIQTSASFLKQGAFYVTDGYLYNALSYSRDTLTGLDVAVTATVQGPGFQAAETITVTLE